MEFTPRSNAQIYCDGPHYMKCPVCGNVYEVTNKSNLSKQPKACSYACRNELTKIRTGSYAPGFTSEPAKKKARRTRYERYGAEYSMQSIEISEKIKQTMLSRYGVDNAMKSDSIKRKRLISRNSNRKKFEIWKINNEFADSFIFNECGDNLDQDAVTCFGIVDKNMHELTEVIVLGYCGNSTAEVEILQIAAKTGTHIDDNFEKLINYVMTLYDVESVMTKIDMHEFNGWLPVFDCGQRVFVYEAKDRC